MHIHIHINSNNRKMYPNNKKSYVCVHIIIFFYYWYYTCNAKILCYPTFNHSYDETFTQNIFEVILKQILNTN